MMRQQPPAGSSLSVLVKEFAMAHLQEAFIILSTIYFYICLESNDYVLYCVNSKFLAVVKKYLSNCTVRIFLVHGKRGDIITQGSNLTARTLLLTSHAM